MTISCYTCDHNDREHRKCKHKDMSVFVTGGSYCTYWESAQICETCKHFSRIHKDIPSCDHPSEMNGQFEAEKPNCWDGK